MMKTCPLTIINNDTPQAGNSTHIKENRYETISETFIKWIRCTTKMIIGVLNVRLHARLENEEDKMGP